MKDTVASFDELVQRWHTAREEVKRCKLAAEHHRREANLADTALHNAKAEEESAWKALQAVRDERLR